jgi:hypothetical protein
MTLWDERDEPVLRWLLENPPPGGVLRIWGMSGLGHGDAPFEGIPILTQAQAYFAIETLRDAGYLASSPGEWSSQGGYTMTQIHETPDDRPGDKRAMILLRWRSSSRLARAAGNTP